jgi:oligoendopeptidase F
VGGVNPDTAPKEPDWDMSTFFSGLLLPDYVAFKQRLITDVAVLRTRAEQLGPVADATLKDWEALLLEAEALSTRFGHLSGYLGCLRAADARDEAIQSEAGRFAPLAAELEKVMVPVRAAVRDASPADFAALLAQTGLAGAQYFLTRLRQRARFTMESSLEGLQADLAVTGISAWGRLYNQVSAKLSFELAVPGKALQIVPAAMTRTFLEDADPAVRKAALDGSAKAWEGVADTVAACLNAIAGTRLTLHKRRGVEHFIDSALFDAGIERATLDTMLDVVRQRQDVGRSYLTTKAKLLGKHKLGYQDLMAPLPTAANDAARMSWDEGMQRVKAAFGRTYPAMAQFADHAFARRWVDHAPRAGKQPGAFCSGSPLTRESRVFMTYNGARGDVQTLAHELGHAFHSHVMRDQRLWQRRPPMTLAETASTFAEQLVSDALLEGGDVDRATRRAILGGRLQGAEAFLLNIPMRYDFEYAFYNERALGEVSVSRLKELMLIAQRNHYGDALNHAELDPWFWASKLHFYTTGISFYNFPYTFGFLFSLGICARAKAEGPSFCARYEALLRRTGSESPESVAMNSLGVDLQQPDFWKASIDLLADDLHQFQSLA